MYVCEQHALAIAIKTQTSMIMIGRSGSGRTTLCNNELLKANVRVLRPCYESFVCNKAFEAVVTSFFQTNHLDGKHKVLFLDDVDVLLTNNRYASAYLLTILKHHFVLMTTCVSEERRVADLKKRVLNVRVQIPEREDLVKHFSNLFQSTDVNIVREVVMNRNSNLRCISDCLSSAHKLTNTSVSCKYFDTHVMETALCLMENSEKGMQDLLEGMAHDSLLLSYIMFDNYKRYLNSITPCENNAYEKRICEMYESASLFANSAYTNGFGMLHIAALLQCAVVRLAISEHPRCISQQVPFSIGYTQIPARAAQHYNTAKARSQFMFENNMTSNNLDLLSEVIFEQASTITNNTPIASYIGNICSKANRVYLVKVIFHFKSSSYK